jgi:hypothetical protein
MQPFERNHLLSITWIQIASQIGKKPSMNCVAQLGKKPPARIYLSCGTKVGYTIHRQQHFFSIRQMQRCSPTFVPAPASIDPRHHAESSRTRVSDRPEQSFKGAGGGHGFHCRSNCDSSLGYARSLVLLMSRYVRCAAAGCLNASKHSRLCCMYVAHQGVLGGNMHNNVVVAATLFFQRAG